MKYWAFAFLLFGLAMLVLVFAGNVDRARDRIAAEQRENIWRARYAEKAVEAERVADTVVRTVTRTKTLRDSVLLHVTDTARVIEYIYQTDTLRVACERCAEQLRSFRLVSDSLLRVKDLRIASLKPRWRDRCGLVLGLGALRDGTQVRAGPTLSVGCKVYP